MSNAMSKTAQQDISPGMVLLLAAATGLIVANLYYAQTLVGPISAATGLSAQAAGLIVTLTQIGYTLGLLFVVPLGDLLENRRLIVTGLLFTAAMLVLAAFSTSAWMFLTAALGIGLGSVAAQIIVPFAAHLSNEATRGHTVGKVVSGLLLGIMLARPVASLVADASNWHVVFGGAAVIVLAVALVLRAKLPLRAPTATITYPALMASLWHLFLRTPLLRRRAAYHAGLFGSFSLFWTVTPLMLAGPQFHLSQTGIAIFALVGMAGAVASPIAGRLADSGHTLMATAAALALGVVGFRAAVDSTRIAQRRARHIGDCVDRAGHGRGGQPGAGPARHLLAGRGSAQPSERRLLRAVLRRRRPGFGTGRLDARHPRLARRAGDRHGLQRRRPALLADGICRPHCAAAQAGISAYDPKW
jgi:predicted MFS family arabinose efflux permease